MIRTVFAAALLALALSSCAVCVSASMCRSGGLSDEHAARLSTTMRNWK